MNIKRKTTSKGTRSQLTYWHDGIRYRYVLGYGLTRKQEEEEALEAIKDIKEQATRPLGAEQMTIERFIPLYRERMEAHKRPSIRRNLSIIDNHLVPFFEGLKFKDIRLERGYAYIGKRQKEGAADGTIERECAVLNAILNYAVDCEFVDKNRLKRMAVPKGCRRTRVAGKADLDALAKVCFPQLWKAIIVALNTGLREQRIVDIDQAWITMGEDGPWLYLPNARTKHKNNPDKIPLNGLAMEALSLDVTYLHGRRIFDNWHNGEVLGASFRRKVKLAGLVDLHFHDLRHTFSTMLENLGIDTRTIDLLMGHKVAGIGETYRHGGPGRDKTLREAVTKLEQHWRSLPLSVPLSGKVLPKAFISA